MKSTITILVFSLAFVLTGPIATFAAGPASVNLGTAGNFVILSKTGISTTGVTSVVGDIGVSPAEATYITGFALTLPDAGAFSTSALITGKIYAPSYAVPTPTYISTAVSDMQTAYTDGAGRAPTVTDELGAGNIGGLTLAPGVYKWGTDVTIPTDVTLSGGANDVWIFQIAQKLNISSAKKVVLAGGAQASNIFWIVAGQTTIGTTAVMNGNILDQTAIVLNTGATLNGRALAQSAVTLDANAVTIPSGSVSATPATPAVPTVTSATPATSATPSSSASSNSSNNSTNSTTSISSDQRATLMAQIQTLQTMLNAAKIAEGTNASIHAVLNNLSKGAGGSDVNTLQRFLISANKGPAASALAKNGSTNFFGELTRSALAEFQASVGISPSLGNFGPITREYLRIN